MKSSLLTAITALANTIAASQFQHKGRPIPPIVDEEDQAIAEKLFTRTTSNITGSSYFTQLLDHNDPSKGTFQQRFWWNAEKWAGSGSPIVMFTPGEIAAAPYIGYLTNATITGLYAQEIKGAVVMIEHRYWGDSSPYDDLTTGNLQLLTLRQSIADFVHFAKTVDLPFDTNHSSNADKAPWVLSGGSYSGALAAWTESTSPGTFWAYHASSAPIEAISDYWQYFEPVRQGMPQNCSKDVEAVVFYMDKILLGTNQTAKVELKTKFGLAGLEHNDDFMSILQSGPWLWQSNSFYTGYSGFYQFCDAIEGVVAGAAITPNASGIGLPKALENYASWVKTSVIPGYCQGYGYTDPMDLGCMNTYDLNNKLFTDHSVNNPGDRQWNWMLCNEPFGYWQDGAPANRHTIVSRLVSASYWQRQCSLWFPETNGFTYGSADPANDEHRLNKYTSGWRLKSTRLIYTNGESDPWRTAGMSSEFRDDGPLVSTPQIPVQVIPGGFHCSDLILKNGKFNSGVQLVIDNEVKQIVEWVSQWPKK